MPAQTTDPTLDDDLPDQVLGAIRSVIGSDSVSLHEPRFTGNEKRYLQECIDSTFVSSVGPFVDRFEKDLTAYTGARHAVAVVNGTAALHVALMLAGVKAGDEVLVPALTFVATANAVHYCGAVPHFVDSEDQTFGVDPFRLRAYLTEKTEQRAGLCLNRSTGRVIRALLPMHAFGHPVDLGGLLAVAHDFGLALVEDSAESLGSFYHGRHTGTIGLLGTLSFNGNKTITAGGGGAILTNDSTLARRAKHLTTTAKLQHAWEYRHDEIGYNYRLPNLNAALGCAQLEQLPDMLASKRELFRQYRLAFDSVPGVRLVEEPERCESNYWLQTILLEQDDSAQRDRVLQVCNDAGAMVRPAWVLMNELAPFGGCPQMDLKISQSLSRRIINIPSSAGLV